MSLLQFEGPDPIRLKDEKEVCPKLFNFLKLQRLVFEIPSIERKLHVLSNVIFYLLVEG